MHFVKHHLGASNPQSGICNTYAQRLIGFLWEWSPGNLMRKKLIETLLLYMSWKISGNVSNYLDLSFCFLFSSLSHFHFYFLFITPLREGAFIISEWNYAIRSVVGFHTASERLGGRSSVSVLQSELAWSSKSPIGAQNDYWVGSMLEALSAVLS